MADLVLRFEFEPGTDLDAAARGIRERLARLDSVAAVDAQPDDARMTGLEIVGAILVGVQIVHGTRRLVAEVRGLLAELNGFRADIAGLRSISLDAGPVPITIDQVTDRDIAQLVDESGDAPS